MHTWYGYDILAFIQISLVLMHSEAILLVKNSYTGFVIVDYKEKVTDK
jgi:hypothetical protein